MPKYRFFLALPLAVFVFAGNVFAGCPEDVYFKQSKSQPLSIPIGYSKLADVDGDGLKDLVGLTMSSQTVQGPPRVVIYKRSANGFDTPPVVTTMPAGFNSYGFELADINGDGKLDLLNHNQSGSGSTYLGNGASGFNPTTIPGAYSYGATYRDINADGRADMIYGSNPNVRYRLGQADGTLGRDVTVGTGSITLPADFNNDGKIDILVWSGNSGGYIAYNQGGLVFTAGPAIALPGFGSVYGEAGDLNGDGRLDIPLLSYTSGGNTVLGVLYTQSDGSLTLTETIIGPVSETEAFGPRIVDADNDGDNDLLLFSAKSFRVVTNDGAGQFSLKHYATPVEFGLTENGALPPTFEDMTGDGRVDIVEANRGEVFNRLNETIKVRENTCTRVGNTKFIDYDGDGSSDMGYFHPADGTWTYRSSRTSANVSISGFGSTGDIPVPQDYDGDAVTDRAIFNPATGYWYVMGSAGGVVPVQWGISTDTPVPADYDGDGKADIAVYRPSNGSWWILNSSDGSYSVYVFGISEDLPVPMDYDGDGKADIAVFRPTGGYWYIQKSTGGYYILPFGMSGDTPIPGDYDHDGVADIAIYRSDRSWWLMRLRDNAWRLMSSSGSGEAGDLPVSVNKPIYGLSLGRFRPSHKTFYSYVGTGDTIAFPGFATGDRIISNVWPQ